MKAFTPTTRFSGEDSRQLFATTFRRQIASIEAGRHTIHLPQTTDRYVRRPGMAYHFKPELFVQCEGETQFTTPAGTFHLLPGQICVMPRGIPHAEVARGGERPFQNVVVCFYNETVAIHAAHESPPGRPTVEDIHFFTTDVFHDLVEYLNRMDDLQQRSSAATATAIKGLLLAEFALLLSLVEGSIPQRFSETERIFRCSWLIRNNLDDPTLSVAALAEELRCSPGHLSKQFHEQTGERILEHINRLRLNNAEQALRHTRLSVKEIAAACGYEDASYFARVFRQATGRSPNDYRRDLQRVACAIEKNPKVVYDDHEEFGFGLDPKVMAAATVRA